MLVILRHRAFGSLPAARAEDRLKGRPSRGRSRIGGWRATLVANHGTECGGRQSSAWIPQSSPLAAAELSWFLEVANPAPQLLRNASRWSTDLEPTWQRINTCMYTYKNAHMHQTRNLKTPSARLPSVRLVLEQVVSSDAKKRSCAARPMQAMPWHAYVSIQPGMHDRRARTPLGFRSEKCNLHTCWSISVGIVNQLRCERKCLCLCHSFARYSRDCFICADCLAFALLGTSGGPALGWTQAGFRNMGLKPGDGSPRIWRGGADSVYR